MDHLVTESERLVLFLDAAHHWRKATLMHAFETDSVRLKLTDGSTVVVLAKYLVGWPVKPINVMLKTRQKDICREV